MTDEITGITPSALKTQFEAGKVPKEKDFSDLIQLAGQVRGVEDENGLELNEENGNLSINYAIASDKLAGKGLVKHGNTLEINYPAASDQLAGTGLSRKGSQLEINYLAASDQLAGTGLSRKGSQLEINYPAASDQLAGTGLIPNGSQLDFDIDLIWKKMLAKTHCASHYAEVDRVCIIFFRENHFGKTRGYIYCLNDSYVGVDANSPSPYNKINLNNIRARRFYGDFGAGAEDNIVRVAEWNGGIAPNSKIQMTFFETDHNHHNQIDTHIYPISELK